MARMAALTAPAEPNATVATGIPDGICTVESKASSPSSAPLLTGTPITGRMVCAASTPARCAAPPAAQVPTGGRKTYSLADGTWRFDVVLDGPHTLVYGTPTAPMVAPVELQFHAPSLTVPSPDFPELASLDILVTDELAQPVTGASVRGSGSKGGSFELVTPSDGLLKLRNLMPGHYRFSASHELFGEGRLERRFEGGEDDVEVITLVQRP